MSIVDYDAMLDQIYALQGVDAGFLSRDGRSADLVVMNKLSGVELPGGPVLTGALVPAVMVRGSELKTKSLDPARLRDGRMTFNGACWSVERVVPKPKPNGSGEYIIALQESNDG